MTPSPVPQSKNQQERLATLSDCKILILVKCSSRARSARTAGALLCEVFSGCRFSLCRLSSATHEDHGRPRHFHAKRSEITSTLGSTRAFASPINKTTRPRKEDGQLISCRHSDCIHEQAKARYLDLASKLPASGFSSKVPECPRLDAPRIAMRCRLTRAPLCAYPEARAVAGQLSPLHKSATAGCP